MTKYRFCYEDPKEIRETLHKTFLAAQKLHEAECELVKHLYNVDQDRLFVSIGYKSLMGYCKKALKISKTQSQRIVTRVRRYDPQNNPALVIHPEMEKLDEVKLLFEPEFE